MGKGCLYCPWTSLSICSNTHGIQKYGGCFGGGPIFPGGGDFIDGIPDDDDAEDHPCPGGGGGG